MEKDKEYYRKKMLEIKLKIAFLPVKERELCTHPYYQELEDLKIEFKNYLYNEMLKEKEKDENDKYKRR